MSVGALAKWVNFLKRWGEGEALKIGYSASEALFNEMKVRLHSNLDQ